MTVRHELVERTAELGAIAELLESASGLLVVEGPAGVGKSALLGHLRRLAAGHGGSVLAAHGSELARDVPFGVARRLLDPVVRAAPEVLDDGHARTARAVFTGELRSGAGGSAMPLAQGLLSLVAGLRRPCALVVDDVQWADAGSLLMLAELAGRLAEVPVVLAVGVRTGEDATDPQLLARLLAAPGVVLRPAALTPAGVATLLRREIPDPEPGLVESVTTAAAGNPLLVCELIAVARTGQGADVAPDPAGRTAAVPSAVRRSALLRLQALGPAAQALAEAVAVLDQAPLALAAAVAGLPGEEAETAADALAARDLLAPGDPLRLAHPLIAGAVRASLSAFARARLHRRAAEALARAAVADDDVATHVLHARADGDAWAVRVLRDAAARALDRGEPAVAARLLRRALDEPPPPEQRGDVLVELARSEAAAGDTTALDRFRTALRHAHRSPDRVAAWHGLSRLLWLRGDFAGATAAARSGRDELAPGADGAELLLGDELAAALLVPELAESANTETARLVAAVAAGRPPTEPTLVAQLIVPLGWRGLELAHIPARARAATAADPLVDPDAHGTPALFVAGGLNWVDDVTAAAELLDRAAVRAVRIGDPVAAEALRNTRAWCHLHTGDPEAAVALLGDTALAGHPWAVNSGLAAAPLALAHLELGDLPAAQAAIALGEQSPQPGFGLAKGRVLVAAGDPAAALAAIVEEGELYERQFGLANPAALPWRSEAAVAAHRLGDADRARTLAGAELARARELGVARSLGSALRAAGLVTGGTAGLALLAEAVEVLASSPSLLERLRALVELGAAQRRAGRRAEARATLTAATDLGASLTATALTERAREELRATGARPRRDAVSGSDALTPAERRVVVRPVKDT